MIGFIYLGMLGILMMAFQEDMSPLWLSDLGFAFFAFGQLGALICYERTKERLEKLERKMLKENKTETITNVINNTK